MKKGKHGTVYCLVYVDDILFASSATDAQDAVDVILSTYDATDEGDASSFLGMAIIRDRLRRTLKLKQTTYIEDMASKYNFDDDQPNRKVTIPMKTEDPGPSNPLGSEKAGIYASMVGSLLYLANCTRPDISFAVGVLSRHMANPEENHLKMVKYLLRYCINTKELGLEFGPSNGSEGTHSWLLDIVILIMA